MTSMLFKINRNILLFLLYFVIIIVVTYYNQRAITESVIDSMNLPDGVLKEDLFNYVVAQRWKIIWFSPALFCLRLILVSSILYIADLFFEKRKYMPFKLFWNITLKAMSIFVLLSIVLCVWNNITNSNNTLIFYNYTSLFYFFRNKIFDENVILFYSPLYLINVVEIVFVYLLVKFYSKKTNINFINSLLFIIKVYGFCFVFVSVFWYSILIFYL